MPQPYQFHSECTHHVREIAPPDWTLSETSIYDGGLIVRHDIEPAGEIEVSALTHHLFALVLSDGNLRQIHRIGEQEYDGPLGRGASWIAPANVPCFWSWESTDEVLMFALDPKLLNRVSEEHCRQVPNSIEVLPVSIAIDPQIQTIGSLFAQELKQGRLGGKLYRESLANLLLVHLIRQYCTTPLRLEDYTGGLPRHKLLCAIAYIHDRLSENISLADIAQQLHLSQYYFCRLFKQSTGRSPYQYLIQQRVERAKQILLQGNMSIAEVAIAVGFSDQSQLTHHFKRRLGITPKQLLQ